MHQATNPQAQPNAPALQTQSPQAPAGTTPVMQGLNLFLRLKNPAQMPALLATVAASMDTVRTALAGLHYVHFARFLPTPDGSMLLVITEFDGDLRSYIMDFVAVMGEVFTAILAFVADAPRLPVQTFPEDFWQFILKNNLSQAQPWSAYERSTVIDIIGNRRSLPIDSKAPVASVPAAPLVPLSELQNNVVRGFKAERALHFALAFPCPDAGQRLLSALLSGDAEIAELPRVSSGANWMQKPAHCVNIGLTCDGLAALGVANEILAQFPQAFRQGPAARACDLGDTGDSAPSRWRLGGVKAREHALVSVFFAHDEKSVVDSATAALRTAFAKCKVTEIASYEAVALSNQAVHFGYRDGISQPHIAGVPSKRSPDLQPQSSAGEFILGAGYINQYGGNFIADLPAWLCNYGSYSAVRILEQDTAGFEQLLTDVAAQFEVDREWIAAKMMGRWRDGTPLTLNPHAPDPTLGADRINRFDYAPSSSEPTYYDDYDGMRCPIGAHARRLNPRSALVTGKPHSRRLIRRGMAYGPPFDPTHPDDGIERGLFGFFVCGDLEMQYEFLLKVWANQNIATSGKTMATDPLLSASGGTFVIPRPGGVPPISFFVPRLIHTRGGLYTFLPGMAALRNLALGTCGPMSSFGGAAA